MYDRAKVEVARGERKVQKMEFGINEKHLLPLDTSDLKLSSPPTPEPFGIQPLSASSATETMMAELPRRRSSSFSELRPPAPQTYGGWGLGSIQEMTPPVTPKTISPPPVTGKVYRADNIVNGHRSRHSIAQANGEAMGVVRDAATNAKGAGIEKGLIPER
jgi:hypothetical protein